LPQHLLLLLQVVLLHPFAAQGVICFSPGFLPLLLLQAVHHLHLLPAVKAL
jgi:hypothetical protein